MMQQKKVISSFFLVATVLLLIPLALADHGEEETKWSNTAWFYLSPFIVMLGAAFLSHYYEGKSIKKFLFILIIVTIALVTITIFYETIQTNIHSWTKGPVHWHADFEIWSCGQRLDLIDPAGFSNKVGTPLFHEHNDDRIHIEGDVMHPEDITLREFAHVIGATLTPESLYYPTSNGLITMKNGMLCNGKPAKLQVFVYRISNPHNTKKWIMTQEKIIDINAYLLAPYGNVPPGDCIIVEFDEERDKTDRICETYEIAMKKGELIWQ